MSETTTIPPEAAAPETIDATQHVVETIPPQATESVEETHQEPEPSAPEKPDKVQKRIANLTRRMGEETRAREAAERRAAEAERLLSVGNRQAENPPDDIEARAERLVAEREFNRRLSAIDTAGKQDIGAEVWTEAKTTLTNLGATSNPAFLQALAEAENPTKIFAHYAEDTDALLDLLARSPVAIAAKIGRLDAELAKPVAKPLSSAPTPAPKLRGVSTPPEPSIYEYPANMSMREWNKMMDAHLPTHLGGKKKAS